MAAQGYFLVDHHFAVLRMLFHWLFFKSKFLRSWWSRQIALSETETFRAQDWDRDHGPRRWRDRDQQKDGLETRPGLETSITVCNIMQLVRFCYTILHCLFKDFLVLSNLVSHFSISLNLKMMINRIGSPQINQIILKKMIWIMAPVLCRNMP